MNPKNLLKNSLSRGSVFAALGSAAARVMMQRNRKRWESMEPLVEQLNSYDMGRGGGKLIQGWLQLKYPAFDVARHAELIDTILKEADTADDSLVDKARNRFLASKALFYMEGFSLRGCRYETLQDAARRLLKHTRQWRDISRRDVFTGKPFEPESLIGATHRFLVLTLESNADARALRSYLEDVARNGDTRDAVDYMQRLVAVTFGVQEEDAFIEHVRQWFEEYRAFEIARSHQQENIIHTSLTTVTGGLPAMLGWKALGHVGNRLMGRKDTPTGR